MVCRDRRGSEATSSPAGLYRFSRNPQYVGAIPALLGYAIMCNSLLGLIAALLVSGWLAHVPFAEEPWCREHLGAAYEEYAAKVPRFVKPRLWRSRALGGRPGK